MAIQTALTLRQIEVIRAVMVSGSIVGAARLLNVSQPGVSRTMKHVESQLKIRLFTRTGGRYVPAPEARDVFSQLQDVHKKINDLQFSIGQLERGRDVQLAIGSVPSIANVMVPRAIAGLTGRFPDIRVNIELLKIEEAIDYLMLNRGELACMSYRFDHPSITFDPLVTGRLVCVASNAHPIAALASISTEEISRLPLIGIDPNDPYGAIMAAIFERESLQYDTVIRARFGTTVLGLVKQNLGIAVLDSFTVADQPEGIAVIPIREETGFQTYVARRNDIGLSGFAEQFIEILKREMSPGPLAGQ